MSALSFSNIQEELEDKLQHAYLKKFIQKPVINNDKLVILYSLIKQTSYSDKKKKNYILTTMLVQIALDTHDLVSERLENESKQLTKNRQLTVLAGDYYSGLYYYMLSKLDDIDMIATLASAIKEINELKMILYYEKNHSMHEFIEEMKALESILIIHVANHVSETSINPFIQNWLLTKKLLREKDLYTSEQHSPLFEVLLNQVMGEYSQYNKPVQAIDAIIRKHLFISEELVQDLPIHFQLLKKDAQRFFAENHNYNSLAMEEG
ncbi:Heptaprenyl diphosphate synthase component 1 [Paraliobacillus sp. PM-2]|uniref:heptaprenyl diphosphate synthase component 1 n=1 Tax=Paraliobacillus sp. PM-2 TaxID=1462524 RepID=UPI00061BA997|nr:heptaprenyl diphosphate synthase component 1 [Paraliobacillus sp. PM-2]CQR46694.1 Heptaprenyl diphosphate synthase component 1 [Paraliobacillus sp. PM-2]